MKRLRQLLIASILGVTVAFVCFYWPESPKEPVCDYQRAMMTDCDEEQIRQVIATMVSDMEKKPE